MVDFAGYWLPVQYKDSIMESHNFVRESAGLFDVSHMGQVKLHGKDRVAFLETLVPSDLTLLEENQARLSVFTNAKGGIIDDCIITRKPKFLGLVVNGACKHKDLAHMRKELAASRMDVSIEHIEDRSLLALQGPNAAQVLEKLTGQSVAGIDFMYSAEMKVGGVEAWVTRCGYTGEDGFEISIPNKDAIAVMKKILTCEGVRPAALGVRDSLRLEAGLCLYGHDLNDDISPVEASLNWLIGKRRREEGGFLGSTVIQNQLKNGVERKRVGLIIEAGAPAREGATIVSPETNEEIGFITSGTFSPTLKQKLAMGYVRKVSSKNGSKVAVNVRGKVNPATVTKMPFVPTKYYKKV
eukprot:gb/GEZN01010313.1/.p1 GENE.gb/GEZN01010313.1/~~gb/GEZN01010313.1/.p1  ORF type:complete len:408 (+),score=49.34 gb/GEZN01010313.1/:165-1226(+)